MEHNYHCLFCKQKLIEYSDTIGKYFCDTESCQNVKAFSKNYVSKETKILFLFTSIYHETKYEVSYRIRDLDIQYKLYSYDHGYLRAVELSYLDPLPLTPTNVVKRLPSILILQ